MEQITQEQAASIRASLESIRKEIARAIVGHTELVRETLICLLCGGHALIEGVPGLGKTYLIRTLGDVLDLTTSRIQFTPDLMPADILGTNVLIRDEQETSIRFQKGPIFAQILLADEINRATPKTQSALLEAMQERGVTIGGHRYPLVPPFMVLATQNPIEMEGTYPLPEAQMDRFFFKLKVRYPNANDISEIIDRTTRGELPVLDKKVGAEEILTMQKMVKEVPIPEQVKDYAIRLVLGTHPENTRPESMTARYVRYGSSPRGAQSLVLAGKGIALLDGRYNVAFDDIREAAYPSLRHRLILGFEGEAEGIEPEEIIDDIVKTTPEIV